MQILVAVAFARSTFTCKKMERNLSILLTHFNQDVIETQKHHFKLSHNMEVHSKIQKRNENTSTVPRINLANYYQ